jgi:hypothetical protein
LPASASRARSSKLRPLTACHALPPVSALPAADNCVAIGRVELDAVAPPTGALGRDHRRAAAEKAIEHDAAPGRAVEDRIGDHRNRFDGRVQRQQIAFLAAAGKGIGSGIMPDIAAVAAELAELDIVAMSLAVAFKDKDELVLAAVKPLWEN